MAARLRQRPTEGDLGRNLAIERFAASSVFSGRSARDFAVGVGGQESFRHLALGGWANDESVARCRR